MKLRELEPMFLKRVDDTRFQTEVSRSEANGIRFLCPVCFETNKGAIGTHGVICWEPSVPQTTRPTPGRWKIEGTGFDDLTLVAGSSSILLKSSCTAHFFIRNGNIEY